MCEIQPISWTGVIPPIQEDPNSEGLEIYATLPLESVTLWIDFQKVDTNSQYTVSVFGLWPDGSERKICRADVTFLKPKPGWPMTLHVNGEPLRFDGLLDLGLKTYPFERSVRIVQTRGVAKPLAVSWLTGLYEAPSVSA